ncbi:MAG: hypothetical protein MZV64_61600 [Ignavibacteriales bacterium]|nr:hypothetical protein [Ignavibacteriales bacterium]
MKAKSSAHQTIIPRIDYLFTCSSIKEYDSALEKKLASLEKAGFPIVRIMLPDVYAIGGEFLRWEIATATACAVVGVNPFDEPNVSESKKNTNDLLAEWKQKEVLRKRLLL